MATAPIHRRMSATDWAILGALSVLWGGSFFFLEIGLRELPPFTLVLARVAGAAVILLAYMLLSRSPLPGPRIWPSFLLLALLNNVIPFAMYGYGQQQISSGLASILNATTPLWGVVVAHIFTDDERATPGKVAGVLLGIAGVVTMVGSDALAGLGGHVFGQIACVTATLCYALAGVYARRFKALGVGPLALSTGQLIAATVVLIPVAAIVDRPWELAMPGAETWGAVAGIVFLSTVIAYVLYFRLLESAGASNSLLVTFLIPVTAILLGTLILHEALEPKHFAGMALIALGLAAIDGRPLGWLRALT